MSGAIEVQAARGKPGWRIRSRYPLYIFLLPAVVVTFLFAYLPMFSNIVAFMDYDLLKGWFGLGSPFVGFKWFVKIFQDPVFYQLIGRTLLYQVVILVFTVPAPFILAMLINEVGNRAFKRGVQTVSYLPHFISWVTVASLMYLFLSTDTTGIVNDVKVALFGGERIVFMKFPSNFPWMLTISSIFKETGWGSIVYLAAIASLDVELYEAAMIDGAGKWKQFRYITFPGVLPTTMILIIFAMAGLLSSNFDQIYNLQNPIIMMDTNTINMYTYYEGVLGRHYSIAAAVGLFQGGVNCLTLLGANKLSKMLTDYGLF